METNQDSIRAALDIQLQHIGALSHSQLERRHGDGTYVSDRLPSGQLQAQRELLRNEVARLVRRASALGVDGDELRELIDAALREAGNDTVMATRNEEPT